MVPSGALGVFVGLKFVGNLLSSELLLAQSKSVITLSGRLKIMKEI